jgi:hypothetical protein
MRIRSVQGGSVGNSSTGSGSSWLVYVWPVGVVHVLVCGPVRSVRCPACVLARCAPARKHLLIIARWTRPPCAVQGNRMPDEATGVTIHVPPAEMTFDGPVRMRERDYFSWRHVYIRMGCRLVRLQAMHEGSVDIGALYGEVDSFFLDCNHLREWMRKDTKSEHALPEAARNEAEEFAQGNDALATAIGFANTSKHLFRDPPRIRRNGQQTEDMTARIVAWIVGGGDPISVRVESQSSTRARREEDALDLAERCAAAWEDFLLSHHVDIPG